MAEPGRSQSGRFSALAVTSTLAGTGLSVSPLGALARLSPFRPSEPFFPSSKYLAIPGWGPAKVGRLERKKEKTVGGGGRKKKKRKKPAFSGKMRNRRPQGVVGRARAAARKDGASNFAAAKSPGEPSGGRARGSVHGGPGRWLPVLAAARATRATEEALAAGAAEAKSRGPAAEAASLHADAVRSRAKEKGPGRLLLRLVNLFPLPFNPPPAVFLFRT